MVITQHAKERFKERFLELFDIDKNINIDVLMQNLLKNSKAVKNKSGSYVYKNDICEFYVKGKTVVTFVLNKKHLTNINKKV